MKVPSGTNMNKREAAKLRYKVHRDAAIFLRGEVSTMGKFFSTFFSNAWHATAKIAAGLAVAALTVIASGTVVGLPAWAPVAAGIVSGMLTTGGVHAVHMASLPGQVQVPKTIDTTSPVQ